MITLDNLTKWRSNNGPQWRVAFLGHPGGEGVVVHENNSQGTYQVIGTDLDELISLRGQYFQSVGEIRSACQAITGVAPIISGIATRYILDHTDHCLVRNTQRRWEWYVGANELENVISGSFATRQAAIDWYNEQLALEQLP